MKADIDLAKSYRLLYPKLVVLVGCYDPDTNKPNAITVAWAVPLSMSPPMAGVSIAPSRYSHGLIERTKEFTINVPTAELAEKVSQCGTASGKEVNKFEAFGLTAKKGKAISAPIIEECVAHLECKLADAVRTGDHTLFVGKVVAAYVEEELFRSQRMDPTKFKGLYQIGGTTYTTLSGEIIRG